jgi:hypothetical protein
VRLVDPVPAFREKHEVAFLRRTWSAEEPS